MAWAAACSLSVSFFLCCRANLESRLASRVLWQVAAGRYGSEEDIYRAAFAVSWSQWFDPACTIRVDVSATKSPLTSLNFVTLKIKDAVCDKIRRLSGRRPSVDTRAPDVSIQAHLTEREFILYLDTTGEPLFKRGQRHATGAAPLRENLAAGILRLAGWTPDIPLLDPDVRQWRRFCSRPRTWPSISRRAWDAISPAKN